MADIKIKPTVKKNTIAEAKKTKTLKRAETKSVVTNIALSIGVYDTKGKIIEKVTLPKEIFGTKVNTTLMAQAVRVYLANQRLGTHSTKTRGEVRGSTRKIYKQKGTGRARHGSIRAPIFVHGGVAFGPKPRDFSLRMPQKMRQKSLFSALSAKFKDKEVKIVAGAMNLKPKTKLMVEVLQNLSLNDKKRKVLLVLPADSKEKNETEHIIRASRNIPGVRIARTSNLNTYQVLDNKMLLFTKEAIAGLESQFVKGA